MAVFITVFIKLPQEWWIHIAQLDFTEFIADHPSLWYVLAGLVGRWRGVLAVPLPSPYADWPFTVDVDRHLPALPEPTVPERFWSAVLIERSYCGADQRDLRPGSARRKPAMWASPSASCSWCSTQVTQFLRRRGRSWSTRPRSSRDAGDQHRHRHRRCSAPATRPRVEHLFFVVLLSLLIASSTGSEPPATDVARARPIATARAQGKPDPMPEPEPAPTLTGADGSTHFFERRTGRRSWRRRSRCHRSGWRHRHRRTLPKRSSTPADQTQIVVSSFVEHNGERAWQSTQWSRSCSDRGLRADRSTARARLCRHVRADVHRQPRRVQPAARPGRRCLPLFDDHGHRRFRRHRGRDDGARITVMLQMRPT